MRALITGVTGFAGSHLAEYLLSRNDLDIFGTTRWRSTLDNILHIKDKLNLIECDVKDGSSVRDMMREVNPQYVFHLAAQTFIPTSWHAPAETISTNVLSTLNIFEAARAMETSPVIHIAGTCDEYGMVYDQELPVNEENPFRPLSPYAVSKVACDLLGYQYYKSYQLNIVRTRAFNHTGPRRGEVFATSNFAMQIAEVEAGKRPPIISVGNLDAKRDFTDVRDMVKAYWLAVDQGIPGEVYVLASGRARAMYEVLDTLLKLTHIRVEIRQDPDRMRPSDILNLEGDSAKFRKLTGWQPEISFEKTLKDLLDYWRERVRRQETFTPES